MNVSHKDKYIYMRLKVKKELEDMVRQRKR